MVHLFLVIMDDDVYLCFYEFNQYLLAHSHLVVFILPNYRQEESTLQSPE